MDIQRRTITYTFAPNWYRPQCICLHGKHLYYGSNYILYEYSLGERMIVRESCMRKALLKEGLKFKDIKITTITVLDVYMIVGFNHCHLAIIYLPTFALIHSLPLSINSVEHVFHHQGMLLVGSDVGSIQRVQYQSPTVTGLNIMYEQMNSKLKGIIYIQEYKYCLLFYFNGKIVRSTFPFAEGQVVLTLDEQILSVDGRGRMIVMLSKNKQQEYFVYRWECREEVGGEKGLQCVAENVMRREWKVLYPKALDEKVKAHYKAALTIKLVDQDHVLVTSKLGEVFSLRLSLLPQQPLKIRPHSVEQTVQGVEVWDDSKHYRQIYGMWEHGSCIYMMSTDQSLSVWQRKNNTLKHAHSIRFITAVAQSVFFCECEPSLVFVLLGDSVVRSCAPLGEAAYCLHEHWKFTKKFTVTKAVCHPTEAGVVAMMTACFKVLLYDIYEDRLMRVLEVGAPMINISFEHRGIVEAIQYAQCSPPDNPQPWAQTKLKMQTYFVKKVDQEIGLLIQDKTKFILAAGLAEEKPVFLEHQRLFKLQRIHHTRHWDQCLLLCSVRKGKNLNLHIWCQGFLGSGSVPLKYEGSRQLFKKSHTGKELYVIEYKGRKASIRKLVWSQAENNLKLEVRGDVEILLQFGADFCVTDHASHKVAFYNQRDDAIQVVTFGCLEGQISSRCYEYNSRIETLAFCSSQYLVIGSKDQAIKVVHEDDLPPFSENKKFKQHLKK